MRIVLLLAALVGTARADTLIASHTDDTLFIHRVTKTSITKVMEEKGGRAYAYAFAGMTLWVRRAGPSGVTLGTIARGSVCVWLSELGAMGSAGREQAMVAPKVEPRRGNQKGATGLRSA
jgi:hypothetical protein